MFIATALPLVALLALSVWLSITVNQGHGAGGLMASIARYNGAI
jgi:hypothetical protein